VLVGLVHCAAVSANQVSWVSGISPPRFWSIEPNAPTTTDVIRFSGPTRVFLNCRLAEQRMGGKPVLYIDYVGKTIELAFEAPPSTQGFFLQPVSGLKGSFGPLEAGHWLFFGANTDAVFSISFRVTGEGGNGSDGGVDEGDGGDHGLVGRVLYLDASAVGANNGSSWINAYRHLRDALAAATNGDEILVAQGVYRPDRGSGIKYGDPTATFQLKTGVKIKGGYAGATGVEPNARDINLYETILSGDLKGNDIEVRDISDLMDEPKRADNSLHVVTGSGTDKTAVLDGFTITGGNASTSDEGTNGGGIYNNNGSPTLTSCHVIGNSADSRGGGLYNDAGSKPTIINSEIIANYAGIGGGGVYNKKSDPNFTNCTFEDNWSVQRGGAVRNSMSSPSLTGCTIIGNYTGSNGGGMYNGTDSRSAITNCNITENHAGYYGGGIYNGSSAPSLKHSVIDKNNAGLWGGGIINFSSQPEIENCIISSNSAGHYGGGVHNDTSSAPILTCCVISGNSAGLCGGGMHNRHSSQPKLVNCVFSGNWTVDEQDGKGGAIHNFPSEVELINCTFVGNSAVLGTALACDNYQSPPSAVSTITVLNCILWDGGYGDEVWENDNSTIAIDYSDVQGGWLDGVGNIEANPCFIEMGDWDPNSGLWTDSDYHLLPSSPCIDAGDPNYVTEPNETDFDGDLRLLGAAVDMGADEFRNRPPIADAGSDQTVSCLNNEMANVVLDGSGSYDPEGSTLTYSWMLAGHEIAQGVNPNIELGIGEHIVELFVNDGIEDSEPNQVVVTIVEAVKWNLGVIPGRIQRHGGRTTILAVIDLPKGIGRGQIDSSRMLELYPGQIKALRQLILQWFGQRVFLLAFFDKNKLMAAVPENGDVEIYTVGQLKTGDYFLSVGTVKIVGSP